MTNLEKIKAYNTKEMAEMLIDYTLQDGRVTYYSPSGEEFTGVIRTDEKVYSKCLENAINWLNNEC